ncbi:uncharacterized protein CBL_04195 [Carabus blaptoides fortunei]
MQAAHLEESLLRRSSQCTKRTRPTLKGPLRVLRLCVLSVILPGFLIAGPLYLRYQVYGDQLYPLAMSDMRVLDSRVSTTWCQRQLVKVNTTFNAFLLPDAPKLSHVMKPISMVRHLELEDDMKEYWGFYLLRGSTVTVSTCVRWPGASLIVIRGHKHLHECAYIGDDSSEEIEEMMENNNINDIIEDDGNPSNKPDNMKRHRLLVQFHHPGHQQDENHTLHNEPDVEDHETDPKIMKILLGQLLEKSVKDRNIKDTVIVETTTKDHIHKHRDQTIKEEEKKYLTIQEPGQSKIAADTSEELFQNVLQRLRSLGDRGQHVLEKLNEQLLDKSDDNLKNLLSDTLKEPRKSPVISTKGRQWNKQRIHYEDNIEEASRKKRELLISPALEDELNAHDEKGDAAIEEGFQPDGIADHRGFINETTLNDKSNSEFWSSFSSSEEALLNCAGLILNLPLTPHRYCERHRDSEFVKEASLANTVTYRVPSNGYYFFVFNSENEVQTNYIRVRFDLNKAMYNVSNPVAKCSNSQGNCSMDLGFFTNEKLVLELPVQDNDTLINQEFVVLSEFLVNVTAGDFRELDFKLFGVLVLRSHINPRLVGRVSAKSPSGLLKFVV